MLNKAVTKTKQKKLLIFLRESKFCTISYSVVAQYSFASIPSACVLRVNTAATIFHDLVCVVLSRVYAKTRCYEAMLIRVHIQTLPGPYIKLKSEFRNKLH